MTTNIGKSTLSHRIHGFIKNVIQTVIHNITIILRLRIKPVLFENHNVKLLPKLAIVTVVRLLAPIRGVLVSLEACVALINSIVNSLFESAIVLFIIGSENDFSVYK